MTVVAALKLEDAVRIATATIEAGQELGFAPLCAVVLDSGGRELVVMRSERAAHYRLEIARAKAAGCIGMGMGGRAIAARAQKSPAFYAALASLALGGMLPVPGGLLIRGGEDALLGAVGVSGDTADNDEAAALAGVAAGGFGADTGAQL